MTTGETLQQSAAVSAAARYIAPSHLTGAAFDSVSDWYRAEHATPLHLTDFLMPELATRLAAALRAVPTWARHASLIEKGQEPTEYWGAEADTATDVTASQFRVPDIHALFSDGVLPPEHRRTLEEFFVFTVLSDAFRDWLKAGTGLELRKRTAMELAAYRNSDGLGDHQDLMPGRVFAVNFYLDDGYRPEHGGRLGYRNGKGEEFHAVPLFNSLSVIPIRDDCWHWVEPFTSDSVGRYTIAMAQHLEES
ncbi:2OG-Fe(II) oxygenase [Streptomyces sp. NPDC046924]|uniref:2OG-Fe(II) oxygenase n=1 Tax=Streptomyces sp. NPDC046924 TaxID=3155136 RepID=UPI0033ED2427